MLTHFGNFIVWLCGKSPAMVYRLYGWISSYLPGLKLSFKLTDRLKTKWSGVESLLSGQK